MSIEEVIERIVNEVMARLESKNKNALVVFTGGLIGLDKALPQLKQLLEDGWRMKFLLSRSAEYVITPSQIKEQLGVDEVLLERELQGLRTLTEGINKLIIPVLTLNSAVKIAQGIADSAVTNIASHALMTGIPIVAAKDACDLRNPVRLQMGMNQTPAAYLDKMQGHLDTLESYGIQLVESGALYASVTNKKPEALAPSVLQDQTVSLPSVQKDVTVPAASGYRTDKKVVSRNDVIFAKERGGVLIVPATALVTPLAKDMAKALDVEIRQEA